MKTFIALFAIVCGCAGLIEANYLKAGCMQRMEMLLNSAWTIDEVMDLVKELQAQDPASTKISASKYIKNIDEDMQEGGKYHSIVEPHIDALAWKCEQLALQHRHRGILLIGCDLDETAERIFNNEEMNSRSKLDLKLGQARLCDWIEFEHEKREKAKSAQI